MQDNTQPQTRKTAIRLVGHAYRPQPNPYSPRGVIPWCECGKQLLEWPINGKTARQIHDEHKKALIRSQESESTSA
jgi:hypothetical protein